MTDIDNKEKSHNTKVDLNLETSMKRTHVSSSSSDDENENVKENKNSKDQK